MCGKNRQLGQNHVIYSESPPRVREKPLKEMCSYVETGITPACAGKTVLSYVSKHLARDHPRVCGKNDGEASELETIKGSPPRVREKLWYSIATGRYSRITPACAGKARKLSLPVVLVWDHPRVCGKSTKRSQ